MTDRETIPEAILGGDMSALADPRRRMVERIRWAVEAGNYTVRADKVAERMLGAGIFNDLF